jgi:uncharacterized membrane protein
LISESFAKTYGLIFILVNIGQKVDNLDEALNPSFMSLSLCLHWREHSGVSIEAKQWPSYSLMLQQFTA